MRLPTLFATLTTLTSLTTARIIGIAAPTTIVPNSTFALTLISEGYIQSVSDIALTYGFQLPEPELGFPRGRPYIIGGYIESAYLGPQKSNVLFNVTVDVWAEKGLGGKEYKGKEVVLSVGVLSLYGAPGNVNVVGWNVTVKVGDKVSESVVGSEERGWVAPQF